VLLLCLHLHQPLSLHLRLHLRLQPLLLRHADVRRHCGLLLLLLLLLLSLLCLLQLLLLQLLLLCVQVPLHLRLCSEVSLSAQVAHLRLGVAEAHATKVAREEGRARRGPVRRGSHQRDMLVLMLLLLLRGRSRGA